MAEKDPNEEKRLKSIQEQLKLERERLQIKEDISKIEERTTNSISDFFKQSKNVKKLEQEILKVSKDIAIAKAAGAESEDEILKNLNRQLSTGQKILVASKQQINIVNLLKSGFNSISKALLSQVGSFTDFLKFLNEADGAIRKLNLNLGLSGPLAKVIQTNLTNAASAAARLGLSVTDLANIQQTFSDETGRLVLLNEKALLSVSAIAKGTSIGAENAAMMAGQFELIGKNAEQTENFYENLVDSSERFGLNSNKVIKLVNDNFKKAQQYVFKGGVKALGDMAQYATKFKVDMTGVFAAIDKSRGLEGAVDTAAQLQVIGGEFAKTDPFQLLFQARNDAKGFAKTIQGLTNNLATFNKQTGEFDIAAGNLDRLRMAAEATGVPFESLIEQAKRGSQIKMIEGMLGGLSEKNRELISSLATMGENGKFIITMPNGDIKKITDLTDIQVEALVAQKETLKARAKTSQTFDEILKNTINELKSTILPALTKVSDIITWLGKSNIFKGLIIGLAGFVGAVSILKGLNWMSTLGGLTGGKGIVGSLLGGGAETATKGISSVGTAATGAAKGVSSLVSVVSNSFVKILGSLGKALVAFFKPMTALANPATILGITVFTGAMIGLGYAFKLFGEGLSVAAPGITAILNGIGVVIKDIGTSVATVITSISQSLVNLSKINGTNLFKLALGIGALSTSLAAFGVGSAIGAVGNFFGGDMLTTLTSLSNLKGLDNIGSQFSLLSTSVNSVDSDKLNQIKETADAISRMSVASGLFGGLGKIFGDGIIVRFADNEEVNLKVDITNTMDGAILGPKVAKYVSSKLDFDKAGKPVT